jgi:hypothetical protein
METITIDLDEYFDSLGDWKKPLTKPKKKCNVIVTRSKADYNCIRIGANFLADWYYIVNLQFENLKNVVSIGPCFLYDARVINSIHMCANDLKLIENNFMAKLVVVNGKIIFDFPNLIRICDFFMKYYLRKKRNFEFGKSDINLNNSSSLTHIGKDFMCDMNHDVIIYLENFLDNIQSIDGMMFKNSASLFLLHRYGRNGSAR